MTASVRMRNINKTLSLSNEEEDSDPEEPQCAEREKEEGEDQEDSGMPLWIGLAIIFGFIVMSSLIVIWNLKEPQKRPILPPGISEADLIEEPFGNIWAEIASCRSQFKNQILWEEDGVVVTQCPTADPEIFLRMLHFEESAGIEGATYHMCTFDSEGKQNCRLETKKIPLEVSETLIVSLIGFLDSSNTERGTLCDRKGEGLLVGLGAGTFATFVKELFPKIQMTSIEIDPIVAKVAHFFGFSEQKSKLLQMDAADFVMRDKCAGSKFDFVVLDAYDQNDRMPEIMQRREFMQALKENCLKQRSKLGAESMQSGWVFINLAGDKTDQFVTFVEQVAEKEFDELYILESTPFNRVLALHQTPQGSHREPHQSLKREDLISRTEDFPRRCQRVGSFKRGRGYFTDLRQLIDSAGNWRSVLVNSKHYGFCADRSIGCLFS